MKFDIGNLPGKLGKGLQKLVGSANQRALNRYQPLVKSVNDLEPWAEGLDADGVKARMAEWREKVTSGQATVDDALPEVFAMTRVASQRTLGLRHFDVQLIGGAVLHGGNIAEMMTGEGKTLVATLPAALNALSGKGVYVVTVNDYLAQRDCDWMAPVFHYLGLTVGAIQSSMSPSQRLPLYESDITYGTNNEFGFDYLRDNMKWEPGEQVQSRLNFAIVDEVDSILVDEARTPLIISGPPEGLADKYRKGDRIARSLKEGEDFEVKLKEQQALLSDAGIEKAEKLAGVESFYSDPSLMDWPHHIEQSLRAHHVYQRDKHYVVVQNPQSGEVEVVIVDEFTGRLMPGRRWSDGLHQAVEAKEGLPPKQENLTLATITLQNYFRMFTKLAGMTGTAMTEAAEFAKIYDLDVVAIPTNREMVRKDFEDQIYLDENDKFAAIAEEIREEHGRGRPILVGTTSIENSERLSKLLKELGVEHNVLNAKHHEREAEIVALAGRKGAVTVATNMAGRGTDIVLGGKPELLWEQECQKRGLDLESEEAKALLPEVEAQCKEVQAEIKGLGGLFVMGTERHEARRIDNQLRGRCGRQGDPGSTKFFLCFDDDLMKIFARDWVRTMMEKLGLKHGERIESPMVSRGIARAQKKVEARNFDIRKNLIEYDEVMDKQRKFIYSQRNEVLRFEGLQQKMVGMFEDVLHPIVEQHSSDKDQPVAFDEIEAWLKHKLGDEFDLDGLRSVARENLFDDIVQRFEKAFVARSEEYGEERWREVQKFLLLDAIDGKWKDHLHAMDVLKAGIGLRSFAQVDPKNEYKKEGYEKFELLKSAIADQVTDLVFKVELRESDVQQQPQQAMPQLPDDPATAQAMVEAMVAAGQAPPELIEAVRSGARIQVSRGDEPPPPPAEPEPEPEPEPDPAAAAAMTAIADKKVGRNDPCPCGSGKKFKKCHGRN